MTRRRPWTHRLRPDVYLERFPKGPHSDHALQLIATWRAEFEGALQEALPAARISLDVLLELLGLSAFSNEDSDRDKLTLHKAVTDFLEKAIPGPSVSVDSWVIWWRLFRRVQLLERRQRVKELGLRPSWFGSLGPPAKLVERPEFWKLTLEPVKYVERYRFSDLPDTQNMHLARAAIAPFEARISKEYRAVEIALRDALARFGSSGDTQFRAALEIARDHIAWQRYRGIQGPEHYQALHEKTMDSTLTAAL
jgi:hypothetical protein